MIRRLLPCLALVALAEPVAAQRPVTLADAVEAALVAAPGAALARADSAAAHAAFATAREFPNPALLLGYSRSAPRHHLEIEQPLDGPWIRGPRIEGARADIEAAGLHMEVERARVRFLAAVAFADAAAATAVLRLSLDDDAAAGELVRIASVRRAAGDASDLDVDLARLAAARARTTLFDDSLAAVASVLRLQSMMGLPVDAVRVEPVAEVLPVAPPDTREVESPAAAAAAAAATAAAARMTAARRAWIPVPSLLAGFEQGDPAGDETGLLPTFGLSIPLPLFNRSGAAVEESRAAVARAEAGLAAARREADLARAESARRLRLARAKLAQDEAALDRADRVASLSLEAYRQGAYTLASVIDAQRAARETRRSYLFDLAEARIAVETARLAQAGIRP